MQSTKDSASLGTLATSFQHNIEDYGNFVIVTGASHPIAHLMDRGRPEARHHFKIVSRRNAVHLWSTFRRSNALCDRQRRGQAQCSNGQSA